MGQGNERLAVVSTVLGGLPLVLSTGRTLYHYNVGNMTRKSPVSHDKQPGNFVMVHVDDADSDAPGETFALNASGRAGSGADAEALRQLGGGLFVLQSGQRHLGLEFATVLFSSFAHGQILSFSD